MTKIRNLIACVGLALACAIVYRFAFWKSEKAPAANGEADMPALTQNNVKAIEASNQTAAAPQSAPSVLQIQSNERIAQNDTKTGNESDGGDAGTGGDGKKLLPVEQFIPNQINALNLGNRGPGLEFLNKGNSSSNNQLLAPPNPENVAGPVVSPETK